MVTILNIVCKLAICAGAFPGVRRSSISVSGVVIHRIVKITVPKTLKRMCTSVVLFAFLFVPAEAKRAVTHVPMF